MGTSFHEKLKLVSLNQLFGREEEPFMIAAHFEGDDYTEAELEKIREFAAFRSADEIRPNAEITVVIMCRFSVINLIITPQNTSYNVKKYSEGFSFEGLY